LKDRIDAHVCENRLFSIDERHEVFPYVSQTVLYELVTVQLRYRKICARWVPRMLTDEHKQLNGLAADFYDEGIVKLVQHLDNVDYIEKLTYVVFSSDSKIIWMNKVFFCL
jgi:oligoribonuclease (3'-5' exoribonuclease)